jgi:hypothetical protein
MRDRPRIGIINAYWHVHSSVAYLASCLEKAGYTVDVFLYSSDESLSGALLRETPFLRVHRFGNRSGKTDITNSPGKHTVAKGFKRFARTILPNYVRAFLRDLRDLKEYLQVKWLPVAGLIPGDLIRKVVEACAEDPYVALIGIEKGGLGVAGAVTRHTGIPLAYYSLELFTWDHGLTMGSSQMRILKRIEERYHRQCSLTIVQDEHRAQALLTSNRVPSSMRMAYLPVSLIGEPYIEPSHWLQSELGLAADKVVILSYGIMASWRSSVALATVAQMFPENWCLVFHGYGSTEIIEEMRDVDLLRRVYISQRLVPASQCEMVVRSAQIGLAFYSDGSLNDCLTGRSSEKIAVYFKCGLPLIALRRPSYEHIEAERAGILVGSIEDIPAAVEEILRHYDSYVENAYRCFRKYYCFEENFGSVLKALKEISQ